ncbi:MAG: S8 family serine peptidase, partial [Thermoplasmata archaeon]|nr:S8 family serine peptidase [Thermoplasmata archaeon]
SQVGASTLWGIYDDDYLYSGGTSMATPIVSAAVAMVREHLALMGYDTNAALVKAVLIITADDMAGQYPYSGAHAPIPNIHEGWGRLNLTRALDIDGQLLRAVDRGTALSTGQYIEYIVPCVSDAGDLRVTLAWTDVAGSPLSSVQLVNDLDLTVIAPNGTVYKGNVFSEGVSVPGDGNSDPAWDTDGNGYDDRNNVECVYVGPPAVGNYRVLVSARDASGQDFALAVHGRVGADFTVAEPTLDAEPEVGVPVNVTIPVQNVGVHSNLTGMLTLGPGAGLTFQVEDLAYSRNDTIVLAVGADGDAAQVTALGTRYLRGLSGDLRAVAFHPDGGYALIAGEDGLFRWSASSHVRKVYDGDLRAVAFHPNGTAIAVGDGSIVHYPGPSVEVLFDPCDSTAGWTTGGTGNVWERGAPDRSQAFPGNHSPASVWGTDLDADHPANADAWLRRNIDLTGYRSPALTFWHYRDFEDGFDGGVVEVLGQAQWEVLVPEGGYDGNVEALGRSGFHSFPGWKKETVRLDDHAEDIITIRFRFASDEFIENAGWFIDDVRVVDRSATVRTTTSDLSRVACGPDSALAGGSELLLSIPDMTAIKPSGLEPAGMWWHGGWYVADVNGSIYEYDGSLSEVAELGPVRDVDSVANGWGPMEGGWIATDSGIYRYHGSMVLMCANAVDRLATDGRFQIFASAGNMTYDLRWETAEPAVSLMADGVPVARSIGSGDLTFEWAPDDFGVVELTVAVNPAGPDRIPEGRYDNNTATLDVVVRPSGRFVLIVDDDGGDDAEAPAVDIIGACHVHDQSDGPVDAGMMAEFDAVVWVVGDEYVETLNSTERDEIAAYLDGGGRLFIYGHDIARGAVSDEWTGWMSTYLHATVDSHSTDNDRVDGVDLYEGFGTEIGDDGPSAISPYGTARAAFEYPDGNASAVLFAGGHRVVYWGFGLHNVVDQDVAAAALNRTLDFLLDVALPEFVADGSPGEGTTGDVYPIAVEVSDDVGVRTVVAWHDDGSGWAQTQLFLDGGMWRANVTLSPSATLLSIYHVLNDFSGNQNSTPQRDVPVMDDDPPTVSLGAFTLRTGENGTVEVVAADNIGLADVRLVYAHLPSGPAGNVSANDTVTLAVQVNASALNATAYAIDMAGNFAVVPLGDLPVEDTLPPAKEEVLTGSTYEPGIQLTLRARFEDNVGVVGGVARVEYAGTTVDADLTPDGGAFIAAVDVGNHTGVVNFTFIPEDAWGNSATMATHTLYPKDTIPPEVAVEIVEGPVNGQDMVINVTVEDAVAVSGVVVTVAMDDGAPFNVEPTGELPNLTAIVAIPLDVSSIVVTVNASDHSGNWNLTALPALEVADPVPPTLAIGHEDP